jgi:DNA-binding NarL/FixJ family response regulator
MSNDDAIRVVIADDHEIFRDGFRLTLKRAENINLVAEAADGLELLRIVKEQKPHVVITDIKMPRLDGIEATRRILAEFPGLPVIGLSMFDEEDLVLEMIDAGAKGYLVKNADKHEVIEAINAVYRGEAYYCKQTSNRLAFVIAKRSHKHGP